jgi:GGDEF domain-containing protein
MIAITLLTLIQTSTIILSGLIARQISRAMGEFEETIAKISYGHIGVPPKPFADEQGIMYRELKRARRYQRPLSVLALKVDQHELKMVVPQLVRKVQQGMITEFTMANIARVLDRELHDFNVIALRDDYFIIVLPELPIEETTTLSQRLGKAVHEEIGVKLHIGAASFPIHAETFESLIEQAIEASSQGKPVDPDPARLEASSTA